MRAAWQRTWTTPESCARALPQRRRVPSRSCTRWRRLPSVPRPVRRSDADREIAATTRELRGPRVRRFGRAAVAGLCVPGGRRPPSALGLDAAPDGRLELHRVLNAAMAVTWVTSRRCRCRPGLHHVAGRSEWISSQSYARPVAGARTSPIEPPVRDYPPVRSGLDEAETARLTDAAPCARPDRRHRARPAWPSRPRAARLVGCGVGVVLSGRSGFPHPEDWTGTAPKHPCRCACGCRRQTAAAWLTRLQPTSPNRHARATPPDAVEGGRVASRC